VIGMKTVTLQVAKLEEVKRRAFSVPSSAGGVGVPKKRKAFFGVPRLRGQSRQDDLGR
jgi:hypothetical protein